MRPGSNVIRLAERRAYYDGLSMLMPQAYDLAWTQLRDYVSPSDGQTYQEVFNLAPSVPDGTGLVPCPATSPATWPAIVTTVGQTVPIPFTVPTQFAILPSNNRRGYLLIENNSSATGAGNTAPTLYFTYDGPISQSLPIQLNKAIPPGSGLVLDRNVPANAIYVAWAGGVGVFTAGGVIEQGLIPG